MAQSELEELRSIDGAEVTRATAASNSERLSPIESRGQEAVISIFSAGFRSESAGASGEASTVPTSRAIFSTLSKIIEGATGLTPSRQKDVEQNKCVRARVIAT